jgi:dolichol kinase
MEHLGIVLLLLFYHYPLINIQQAIEHGHRKFVDLPIKNGELYIIYIYIYPYDIPIFVAEITIFFACRFSRVHLPAFSVSEPRRMSWVPAFPRLLGRNKRSAFWYFTTGWSLISMVGGLEHVFLTIYWV